MPQTNWDDIVENEVLKATASKRGVPYIEKTGWETSLAADIDEGWELATYLKASSKSGGRKTKLRKEKLVGDAFEDEVWTMFYKMGFYRLNKTRKFTIYDLQGNYNQQIDVFAADDDTVLVVECKAAKERKKQSFKQEIDSLGTHIELIQKAIKKNPKYADKKLAFIWATKKYTLNSQDRERLNNYNICYFNDDAIRYYTQLAAHLGSAARYQLLGDIFRGKDIKGMDMRIPAIKGTMGGLDYYAFSIEPEKLLKISYVLHHSLAITGSMPTYQRIIKKQRLTEIRKFINGGGYFPNSVIISIDTGNKKMQFDQASCPVNSELCKIGTLHLPQKYHSAYIIDGQHRLYGYSDSDYASKNTIPVVAFVNLDQQTQMKLFMEINENQKSVPKTLRVVLRGDLFWGDDNKGKQRDALRSRLAQQLGSDDDSPLKDRVVISEDTEQNDFTCISVEAIQNAIKSSGFLSTYNAQNARVGAPGSFDIEDVKQTFDLLYPFLRDELAYISQNAETEWERGKNGILTMNRGIQGCIRLISDIVDMLIKEEKINPQDGDLSNVEAEVNRYLDSFIEYVNQLTADQREELLKYKGSGGDKQFWRRFQNAVHEAWPDTFNPEGLAEFNEDEMQKYNSISRDYIAAIEKNLHILIETELRKAYPTNWEAKGIPAAIHQKITTDATSKNYLIDSGQEQGEHVDPWDFVSLSDFREIVTYGNQWSSIFCNIMVRPEDKDKPGDKKVKTQWLEDLQKERNGLFGNMSSTYSVKKANFDVIESVYKWLCVSQKGES